MLLQLHYASICLGYASFLFLKFFVIFCKLSLYVLSEGHNFLFHLTFEFVFECCRLVSEFLLEVLYIATDASKSSFQYFCVAHFLRLVTLQFTFVGDLFYCRPFSSFLWALSVSPATVTTHLKVCVICMSSYSNAVVLFLPTRAS